MSKSRLHQLANHPRDFLNVAGSKWDYKSVHKHIGLKECHCSEVLSRNEGSLTDYRAQLDARLTSYLTDSQRLQDPIHVVDIGPGYLFSSAVRIAKLASAGAQEIHFHLVDPLFDMQKMLNASLFKNFMDAVDCYLVKNAWTDFLRLMHDCGLSCAPGNSSAVFFFNNAKVNDVLSSAHAVVHLHVYSELSQIPKNLASKVAAVLAVDVWPPITPDKLYGDFSQNLSSPCLMLSCLQAPPTQQEFEASLSDERINDFLERYKEIHTQKGLGFLGCGIFKLLYEGVYNYINKYGADYTRSEIKALWSNFVKAFYERTGADFKRADEVLSSFRFSYKLRQLFEGAICHPAVPHLIREEWVRPKLSVVHDQAEVVISIRDSDAAYTPEDYNKFRLHRERPFTTEALSSTNVARVENSGNKLSIFKLKG